MNEDIQNFLDTYEKNAKTASENAGVVTSEGELDLASNPNESSQLRAGESFYDETQELVGDRKFEVDTGAILASIDYGADKPTYDEKYCAFSLLSGRIKPEDLDKSVLPHMVAAVSHTLFGTKNDFDGTIIGNTLKIYDKTKSDYIEGYDRGTKKWDAATLLNRVKESWDIISDTTGKKRMSVYEDEWKSSGLNKGGKNFFSEERSIEQLDYMFKIASENIGKWDKFKLYDDQVARQSASQVGIPMDLQNWFGIKSVWNELSMESDRFLRGTAQAIGGDGASAVKTLNNWHYALDTKGFQGSAYYDSDMYILDVAADTLGVKRGDYAAIRSRVENSKNRMVNISDKDGNVQAIIRLADGLVDEDKLPTKTSLMIDSANEVYYKLNVVNKFVRDFGDAQGRIRLADAIGTIGGEHSDAAEGVALYMTGKGENADALREWANNYLDGATDEKDAAKRFDTVQRAFHVCAEAKRPFGVLPYGGTKGFYGLMKETGAGVPNLALDFLYDLGGFFGDAYSQSAYWVERGVDKIKGESEEDAIRARREHLIDQQVRSIAATEVYDQGSVTGFVGKQILSFKAFEIVFGMRLSTALDKLVPGNPKWATTASNWLKRSGRGAKLGEARQKASGLLAEAEEIELNANRLMASNTWRMGPDNLRFAESGLDAIERAEALRASANKALAKMEKLVGNEKALEIMDFCRPVMDRTLGLYTLYASSANEMEMQSANKYAQIMEGRGTGYDDKMWSDAMDAIKVRSGVSTSFMLGIGNFLERMKAGAGSAAENEVGARIREIERQFVDACKRGDMNAVEAWILGFRTAFGEGVLREAGNMYRMGFGMGTTGQLGENVQDAYLGVAPWSGVGDNVIEAGASEGASMGVTIAFMRSLRGLRTGRDMANRNLAFFKTMAQGQRPENIVSSILANNKRLRQSDESVEEMTVDTAKAAFAERLSDYFQKAIIADDAQRDSALKEWRKQNRELCGEEGAKTFDAFVHDIKYSPQMFDWHIERMGQRMTAEDLSKTLKVGGIENTVKTLEDGSFAFDLSFDFGGKKITSKLLFKAGKIYVTDGDNYKTSFALDVVKNILEGNAPKELIEKYNELDEEQRKNLESGIDVGGILSAAADKMSAKGLFFTKDEAVAGKKSGEENLVDIENPEIYDGIVFLATGKAEVGTTRHEVLGHAVLDALKRSGVLTDTDMNALKEHFGGDNKWEERFVDSVVKAASAGDAGAAKDLLPQQRTLIDKVRGAARGVLEAMHIVKKARGPEATFNVEKFMNETLDRANETVKLRAERDRMEEIVRANAEKAMEEARQEAAQRRSELEKAILEEQERNKTLGQERAVRIAKSRDEMRKVAEEIERLSNTAKTVDDYLAAVEKAKGDFIKHLKKFGFDKGEVGKLVEDWYLKTVDAYGDAMMERVEAESEAAEAKAKADALEAENKVWREKARKQWMETNRRLEQEAIAKAKAEYKARIDAERQRLEAKAESKKRGEELAKQLAVVVNNAEQIGYDIYKNLRDMTSVAKFDAANKALLKAFDRAVAKIPKEVVKVHRDALKREMYEARKKMELKADAEKIRKAEEKKAHEEQLAKEREARAKQREAEEKARQKKAAEAKRKAEAKKKADDVAKEVAEKAERVTKAQMAAQKKARIDAELVVKGYELMQNGQPIPNKCVIAGLKGEQLTRKRAAMRKAGYYYDKDSDCWVNKKTAPKKFKKAAAKTVAKAVNNVVNAKVLAKTKGTGANSEEFYMGILNSVFGGDGEVAEGSDTTRKTAKPKAEKPKEEPKSEELKLFEGVSALVRQQADAEGWSKEVLEEKLRTLASLELERDEKTGEVRIKGKKNAAKAGAEKTKEEPKAAPKDETPDNKTLREEKKWWTKQLTAEERLGLAVIEVLGKPWGVVYCAGEVIQGGEQLRLAGGQKLPEGAVVRPFSVSAVEKALDAMADRKRTEGVIEAEMRTKPFFNAEWAIGERNRREERKIENANRREEEARKAEEKREKDEIDNLRSELSRLSRESADIDAHTVEKKTTAEELEKLNMAELLNFPAEYTKDEADAMKADIAKRVEEINAEIKRRTMPRHADGVEVGKELGGGELKDGGAEGKMMVAFREGTERLFMREYDVLHDKAKELVDEMMDGFLLGPAAKAAEEIVKSGEIDARSMIPNWMINERVELANSPEGFSVKLPSGLRLFIRKGGFGGDNIRKVRSAKELGDTEGLHAEVQIEFADGKAKMPYGFIKALQEDDARVAKANAESAENRKKVVAALQEKGVGKETMKKIESVGLLGVEKAEHEVNYTVADFFPDSKNLADIYPDTYQNTDIIIRGSERAKSLVDSEGKPVPEPLFAEGQYASLDEAGNIIIDVSKAGKRTRTGDDKFEDALLRDITSCVVKKIRREDHLDDDTARSATYFAEIVNGVTQRDKKTGASTKFRLRDDKSLTEIAHMAIRKRFEKRKAVGLPVDDKMVEAVAKAFDAELQKTLNDCFEDFIAEREAIMFANRFGLENWELADSFSRAQWKAYEGALINPFDQRFTTRQKSDSYAQYYRQVLRRMDALISEGVKEHRDRSLTNEFDQLLDEFLRYNYRKNAGKKGGGDRGGEIFTISPELKTILGIENGGMRMADEVAKQKIGDTDKFEDVVVAKSASPAQSLIAKEEAEIAERRNASLAAKGAAEKPKEMISASQMKRINEIKKSFVDAMRQFAAGKNRAGSAKKLKDLKTDIKDLLSEIHPKAKDEKLEKLANETMKHFTLLASGETYADPEGELKHVVSGGRMSVDGVGYEEDLIGSVAAKIAWDKARHRGGDLFAMGDRMLEPLTAELVGMGIPKADAKKVASDIIESAKVVAKSIIDSVDANVSEAQVIAEAKTKAAKQALGNKIYKSFRKGYSVGREGVDAHDRAERIVERQRMRAIRRAVGYTMADLNSELGINLISDLVNIGRDGFKYGTAKDLADDLVAKTVASFRVNNYEMRNATDGEIKADPVFRAELAATVSSWLVEAAKSLSYGQERELAIRDAMKLRVTAPPTLKELVNAVEHHAEMLGKNLGRMDVEATLKEIEKLIDARPKLSAEGELDKSGAAGGTAVSETARVYARAIEPRLQEYWKFVKDAMWMDGDKVRETMDALTAKLDLSDTDVAEIGGKTPSELKAEQLAERDAAVMKLNALFRYGALKEKSAGEVLDVYRNDIATDIAFAAERFLAERKRRMDENAEVANDFIDEISELLKNKRGYEDIGKAHRAFRNYYMWNVPDMFAKFGSYFKTDSKASERVAQLRRDISLAHEEQMRLTSMRQGEMIQAVEQIYGVPFSQFVQMNCVPDPKFRRFSRSSWAVPVSGGPTAEYWTGKYYQHDMPKLGKKKGDKIYETLHLAVPKTDPRHGDKTKFDTELSMANLIYIYAANRQKDMERNAIIYGRDAAYMRDLEETIGVKGIMLADRIVSLFDSMRMDISPVSEYITGMPLMSPDRMYIPLVFLQDKSADRVTRYTVNPIPKFLMNRRFHDASMLKEDTNILELTSKRIQDAYHYKAFGVLADNVKEQLASRKVVTMFHKLLGGKAADSLYQQLNETFNGGVAIDNQGGVGIRNFITATCLGFSPSSSMKQLEGIGGWGLGMNPAQWAKMVLWDKWFNSDARDGINTLHQTGFFEKHKTALGLDTYQRAEGFSEPMLLLMNARESGGATHAANAYTKAKEWYKEHMLDFMRFFDRISTDFGAGTYYASRKNFYRASKNMTDADAHRMALADTDYMIQLSQASGRPEFMHNMQRAGTAGKILTQFVGPTLVRAGVEIEAAHRHFMVDRSRKSFNALVSKLFAAHVICPAMLTTVTQLANYLFRERDNQNAAVWDDFASRLMVSMLIGPMSGVLFVGQIADGALKKVASHNTRYRPRGYEVPMTSKLNSIADGLINVGTDASDIVSCVLDGAEITPQMLELIRQDSIRLLRPNIPMLQFIQMGVNIYGDVERSMKKK